jgi:CxxC motif-containing protein (DUF1111 family)
MVEQIVLRDAILMHGGRKQTTMQAIKSHNQTEALLKFIKSL